MYKNNIVHESVNLGTWRDQQVPNTYSHYADFVMETLLVHIMPIIENKINMKLIPTYSYARIYEKGSVLKRHKDRPSCEVSATLNLGGDNWSIFIDPTGASNVIDEDKEIIKDNAHKGNKVDLNPSDILIYKGNELEHWREEFKGNICVQVFLHYNKANGKYNYLYDTRPLLGLPEFTRLIIN
jgi:hypothetical protein